MAKGDRFFDGSKPLKRNWKVERFSRRAPERKREFERVPRSSERKKALKGEAQERRELKETSQDLLI
jgi:hypothetical protein